MMKQISIAKDLINNNKLEQAIEILNTCKNINSNNWEIFFELGKVYYIKKDFKSAIYNLEQSLKLNNNLYAKLLLAKSLNECNFKFRALKLFLTILKVSVDLKENINIEVENMFLNRELYFITLRYIDKYDSTNILLKEKVLNLFIVQIGILNFKGDSSKVKRLALKALKTLNNIDIKTKNILLNEIEIADNKIKLKTYPRLIKIGLTQNCNLRCKMCVIHKQQNIYGKITKTDLRILKTLLKYATFVEWIGGEPLAYKYIDYFIELANKNNVKQSIITNGLLLNETIIKKMINYNFDLTISIDSVDKKMYENIRYGGNFDTLLKNIDIVHKYRTKYKSINKFKINAVLSRWNYQNKNNFIDIIKFANKYNFTDIDIYCDYEEKDINLKKEYIDAFNLNRDELLKLAKDYGINLSIQVPNKKYNDIKNDSLLKENNNNRKEKYCLLAWKKVYINFSKIVSVDCPCPEIGVLEKNTKKFFIDKIWNGEKICKFRKNIVENKLDFISNICRISNYRFLRKEN